MNCACIGEKQLSPRRMQGVKSAVYGFYPLQPGQEEAHTWSKYGNVIDSSCRQVARSLH